MPFDSQGAASGFTLIAFKTQGSSGSGFVGNGRGVAQPHRIVAVARMTLNFGRTLPVEQLDGLASMQNIDPRLVLE